MHVGVVIGFDGNPVVASINVAVLNQAVDATARDQIPFQRSIILVVGLLASTSVPSLS